MGIEIERKFLIKQLPPADVIELSHYIEQGYLSTNLVVRVRICDDLQGREWAKLTVKGKGTITRLEFEYDVPLDEARQMMAMSHHHLFKHRHFVPLIGYPGRYWEVDEFDGALEGLLLVEVELKSEKEAIYIPDWVGKEVTEDPRYSNVSLAKDGLPEG